MLERHSHRRVLALAPGFSGVLSSIGGLGELFFVMRNEACLLGAMTEGLQYADMAYRRMAWDGDLTLKFSTRHQPVVLAYTEQGEEGEIAGIEFFDAAGRGCLKICRTAEVDRDEWNELVASLTCGEVDRASLSTLRQTNHLNSKACCERCREKQAHRVASQPPVAHEREKLRRFVEQAIHEERRIDVTLPCGLLRAQSTFVPTLLNWQGQWAYLSAETGGCHLRLAEGISLDIVTKSAGIRVLNLFDERGQFAVRLVSRPHTSIYL